MGYILKNKKVLIVGLGRSGIATAKYAAAEGAKVTVSDKKERTAAHDFISQLEDVFVEFSFGKNDPELMLKSDIIIVSPGVPPTLAGLDEARKKRIPIIGELELAMSEIKKPIIAVTGTNGKTTTVSLIGHLLSSCGIKNCVGGNIGEPLLNMVDDANNSDFVVVEVSSFQIETTPSLSPHIAILLNITADHLDRHQAFDEYANIKVRLFDALTKSDFGIYNALDKVIRAKIKNAVTTLIPFNSSEKINFRGDVNAGGWFENGDLWTKLGGKDPVKWSMDKVNLPGAHNRENILAAVLAAEICGGEYKIINTALQTFKGLAHRIEFVGEFNGVRYFDDSKGTNVGATVAALENFRHGIILIAGGQDKGGSYKPMENLVRERVKKMILIGEAKERINKELGSFTETVFAKTMEDAVRIANSSATAGNVVLLSPACASYDMFRDYVDRGEKFVKAVQRAVHRTSYIVHRKT